MIFKTEMKFRKLMMAGLILGSLLQIESAMAFGKCGFGQVSCNSESGCCVIGGESQFDFASASSATESTPARAIVGTAATGGTIPGSCDFAPPSPSDAETDANQQALEYCKSQNSNAAVRVTEFTYDWNLCVWGGVAYKYAHDVVQAQASYRCE